MKSKRISITEREIDAIYSAIDQIEHDCEGADEEYHEWAVNELIFLNNIIKKYYDVKFIKK